MVAGIIGVPLGALLSTKLKLKFPRADPVICGIGLAITTFLFFLSLMWGAEENIVLAFVLIFIGEISLNLNGFYFFYFSNDYKIINHDASKFLPTLIM